MTADDGSVAVQNPVGGGNGLHQRVVHCRRDAAAVFGGNDRVNGSLSPIGNRNTCAHAVLEHLVRRALKQYGSLFA